MKPQASRRTDMMVVLTALGVVYGDIGTSPLYAVRECFHGPLALPVTDANVQGVLSLIFWSLLGVISVKYLTFVLRANNDGEGGILALMALVMRTQSQSRRSLPILVFGLFGSGLLLGDGIITPAISVMSAVEGLSILTPTLHTFVLPIALVILIGLFLLQKRGTARVGKLFGPIMVLWFTTIAFLGLVAIARHPSILVSLSPHYGVAFLAHNRYLGFVVLGIVFLVVTGGEALYADMGHFGVRPHSICLDGFGAARVAAQLFRSRCVVVA